MIAARFWFEYLVILCPPRRQSRSFPTGHEMGNVSHI